MTPARTTKRTLAVPGPPAMELPAHIPGEGKATRGLPWIARESARRVTLAELWLRFRQRVRDVSLTASVAM